jgi:hypothetical protein
LKKYAQGLDKWVALGWRQGSQRSIDFAFWLDYPFEQDPEMDDMAAAIVEPRR